MHARNIYGVVHHRAGADFLARLVDADGVLIQPGGVASVNYSVFPIDGCDGGLREPVAGHTDVGLTPQAVLYDVLQLGGVWTTDSAGYNFRHTLDVSSAEAFPDFGGAYLVRYEVDLSSGERLVTQFRVRAI